MITIYPNHLKMLTPCRQKKLLKRIARFNNLNYINQASVIARYEEFSSHITVSISFLSSRLFRW